MTDTFDFDRIRPFLDHEVEEALIRLTSNEYFLKIIDYLFPSPLEQLVAQVRSTKTVQAFQENFIYSFVEWMKERTTDGIIVSGLENLDKDESYLFMSNHRDIVLDSAFLNFALFKNDFDITEIAIGDNLMIYPWIEDLVKMNRSFIVERSKLGRQRLESSINLSAYINHTINEKKRSIWIAQREGRTKDGNDKTQVGLLKMLTIGRKGDFVELFQSLRVVPVAISYEYEPCDVAKVREQYRRSINPEYKKDPKDDLLSMKMGMENPKGRVHFTFSRPINKSVAQIGEKYSHKNEQYNMLANVIDSRMYELYKLWPINYVAADLINKTDTYKEHYTLEEKEKHIAFFEKKLDLLKDEGELEALRKILLNIYARPVFNKYQI